MRRSAVFTLLALLAVGLAAVVTAPLGNAQESPSQLYRTVMLRAAPGELTAVIDAIKEQMPRWQAQYPAGPWWMRHSQGDQWDLLLLFPMDVSVGDRWGADTAFEAALLPRIAWREELFVHGPPLEHLAARFDGAGYFHIEIFVALAGKRDELLDERRMENAYLEGTGRAANEIFTRVAGAAWDSYTLGFYRDLKHYAESADVTLEEQERAAVAAGFASAAAIGPTLRTLIASHHDTLAVAVR